MQSENTVSSIAATTRHCTAEQTTPVPELVVDEEGVRAKQRVKLLGVARVHNADEVLLRVSRGPKRGHPLVVCHPQVLSRVNQRIKPVRKSTLDLSAKTHLHTTRSVSKSTLARAQHTYTPLALSAKTQTTSNPLSTPEKEKNEHKNAGFETSDLTTF